MSEQYPGGWLTKSPPVAADNYETTPLPGVWNLTQQAALLKQNLWPIAGNINPVYWIATFSPPTGWGSTTGGVRSAVNSSDQSILTGLGLSTASSGYYPCRAMMRVSKNGVILWTKAYFYTTGGDSLQDPTFDGSGNVYYGGYAGTANNNVLLLKYVVSDGTLTWSRQSNLANGDILTGVTGPDSSGNFYSGGYNGAGSGGLVNLWIKFNSSGTLLAQVSNRTASYSNAYHTFLNSDTSGNCYFGGTNFYEGTYYKYSNTGSVLVQSRLGNGTYGGGMAALTIESRTSPSYFYSVAYAASTGATCNLWKVATSNGTTVAWSKNFPTLYPYGGNCIVDASGNVYMANGDSGNAKVAIFKFNSSGTLLWQREISNSGGNVTLGGLAHDSTDSALVVNMTLSGTPNLGAIMRIPDDGSKTGTYGTWTYAASSYTVSGSASGSWTSDSTVGETWSGSLGSGTGTDQAVTPTSNRTVVP